MSDEHDGKILQIVLYTRWLWTHHLNTINDYDDHDGLVETLVHHDRKNALAPGISTDFADRMSLLHFHVLNMLHRQEPISLGFVQILDPLVPDGHIFFPYDLRDSVGLKTFVLALRIFVIVISVANCTFRPRKCFWGPNCEEDI